MKRIVLTGGPGAGKSVISQRIAADHPEKFIHVPEAATQVYTRLQTRWDLLDTAGRRDIQRQIYQLQLQQEDRIARENPSRILLLDRGTVDGSAYWPDGPADYWRDLGTTVHAELNRYDRVIWMESCAALGLYDGNQSNECRHEDAAAAIATGKALLDVWSAHLNLKRVGSFTHLADKIAAVEELLATD